MTCYSDSCDVLKMTCFRQNWILKDHVFFCKVSLVKKYVCTHSKLSTSHFECFKSFLPLPNIGAFKLAWLFENFKSCDAWSQHLERNMRLFISYDGRLRKGFRAQRKERADEELEQYNSFSSWSRSRWHWWLRLGPWWPQSVDYDQKKVCQLMMTKEMMMKTKIMMTNRGNGRAWPTVGRHLCISSCQACTCTIIFMIMVIIVMIIIIMIMVMIIIICDLWWGWCWESN